nr:MAG TPA: hypothetical protein [Caudoviricetes sp.]
MLTLHMLSNFDFNESLLIMQPNSFISAYPFKIVVPLTVKFAFVPSTSIRPGVILTLLSSFETNATGVDVLRLVVPPILIGYEVCIPKNILLSPYSLLFPDIEIPAFSKFSII